MESQTYADGALPTFIILGAMKCGTSSLHAYLGQHPQIQMSQPKELNFFMEYRQWRLGWPWYRNHFNPAIPLRGESSTGYSKVRELPAIVERMAAALPELRLIYLVRDPVERILSHYAHSFTRGYITESLEHHLRDFRTSWILQCTRYAWILDAYLQKFPKEQIRVYSLEDLSARTAECLRGITSFLGADPDFDYPNVRKVHNKTEFPKEILSESLERELRDYFRPDLENLRREWGVDLRGSVHAGVKEG